VEIEAFSCLRHVSGLHQEQSAGAARGRLPASRASLASKCRCETGVPKFLPHGCLEEALRPPAPSWCSEVLLLTKWANPSERHGLWPCLCVLSLLQDATDDLLTAKYSPAPTHCCLGAQRALVLKPHSVQQAQNALLQSHCTLPTGPCIQIRSAASVVALILILSPPHDQTFSS
jgi:hypothetical protein